MARPMKPLVRGGGYYPSNRWIPLVYPGGYTTMNGGEPPIPIEWKTVSGSAPLTFSDALSNEIRSLIQYGKCVTSGGDIYCNNGKMTAVDDELPSGYKRITGIKFDGDFWYNTNEALTGDDDVTMTLANTATSGQNVFGSYNGTSGDAKNFSLYIYGGGSASSSYFRYGEQRLRPKFGGNERTITFGKSGTSGFATDVTATPETFETEAPAYIGMLPNSSSPAYAGSIMGSIIVGARLKWIPCERESDGVIGYYEKYNRNFIAPTGSGTPVSLGYDASHLNVLSVVGTPEVLSVGGNLLSRDGETTGKIITSDGTVSDNSSYSISAPFVLPAGNYTCTWQTGSGSRPFSVFAVDESGTPQPDGKLFYQQSATAGINTGEFAVEAETLVVASYRRNVTDLAIYSHAQAASVANLFAVGDYADEVDVVAGAVTRRVGMLVLDGTEADWLANSTAGVWMLRLWDKTFGDIMALTSTHFTGTNEANASMPDNSIKFSNSRAFKNKGAVFIKATAYSTLDDFKAYLAAQYAAGTPVIVLYPLAEATTEQVTAQPMRTAEGNNTVNVTSNVDPVDLSAEYATLAGD